MTSSEPVALARIDSRYMYEGELQLPPPQKQSQLQLQQGQQQRRRTTKKKPSAWWTTHRHHGPSDLDFHNPYAYHLDYSDSDSDSDFDFDGSGTRKQKVTLKAWQLPDRGAITIILTEKEPLTSPRTPPPIPPPQYSQHSQHPLRQHPHGYQQRYADEQEQEQGQKDVGGKEEEEVVDGEEDEKNDKHTVLPMYFARSYTGGSRTLAMRHSHQEPPPPPVPPVPPVPSSIRIHPPTTNDSKIDILESTQVYGYPDEESKNTTKHDSRQIDLEAQHHSAEYGASEQETEKTQEGEELELVEEYTGGTWAVVLVAVLCGGMVFALIMWQASKYENVKGNI